MSEVRKPAAKVMPETPENINLNVEIPLELLREYKQSPRIVIKYPGLIGVPLPDVFLSERIAGVVQKSEFQAVLVPKQMVR